MYSRSSLAVPGLVPHLLSLLRSTSSAELRRLVVDLLPSVASTCDHNESAPRDIGGRFTGCSRKYVNLTSIMDVALSMVHRGSDEGSDVASCRSILNTVFSLIPDAEAVSNGMLSLLQAVDAPKSRAVAWRIIHHLLIVSEPFERAAVANATWLIPRLLQAMNVTLQNTTDVQAVHGIARAGCEMLLFMCKSDAVKEVARGHGAVATVQQLSKSELAQGDLHFSNHPGYGNRGRQVAPTSCRRCVHLL